MVITKQDKTNNINMSNKSEFPPGMAPKMLNLLNTVENLETLLEPLIEQPHNEAFIKMNSMEKSKMGMMESYTVNSLFWVLMKSSSETITDELKEDYKIEMGRLKDIQKKIAEVESRSQRPQTDVRAVSRIIKRGIGNKSKDNKGSIRKLKKEEK